MKASVRFPLALSVLLAAGARGGEPAQHVEILKLGGSVIHLQMDTNLALPASNVVEWVQRAADAVTNYLGHFPVKSVILNVSAGGGGGVNDGVTHGGARIDVRLGSFARARDLRRDWILTHEMFHLAFPSLRDRYTWMMEGLSDYLEPIARARAGQLRPQQAWREFVEGLPQGLPEPGQRGLDHDDTRERIYWGGNLYWLMADIRIRQQTGNRRSVDDAIRAILDDGGDGSASWSLAKVLKIGDKATGTTVLKDAYEEFGANPGTVDLNELWQKLGIHYERGRISFDDTALWAKTRAAIMAP
ncbi:MAG TPA: hypothetical protein VGO59_04180 [Verrucomicrobiae bacterium]